MAIASAESHGSDNIEEIVDTPARSLVGNIGLYVLFASCVAAIVPVRLALWSLAPGEFDLVRTLPLSYWLCLAIGTCAGVYTLARARSEERIAGCVAGMALLYGPSFLAGIYPAIAGWDSFLHAAPARSLIAGLGIPASNYYAQQYPGAPTSLAIVGGVMGLSPLVAGVAITMVVQIGLVLALKGIARVFMGPKASAWTALAIFAVTPTIVTNDHFSPWLVGYIALWALVLMFTVYHHDDWQHSLSVRGFALLLASSAIVSHPFLPLIATALGIGFAFWIWRERPARVDVWWLIAAMGVTIVAWILYVATIYFGTGIVSLRTLLLGTKDVVDSWTPLPFREVARRASPAAFALTSARLALYAGAGLVAVSGLLLRETRRSSLIVLGITALSGTTVLIGFASEAPWIQRLLYFVPALLVIAAGVALRGWAGRLRFGRVGHGVAALAIAGAMLVGFFLWHPPSLLYSLHPQQAGFVVWPQESAAAAYVAGAAAKGEEVTSDLQSMIVYSYQKPDYPAFRHGVSMGSNVRRQVISEPLLFPGTWIIRSGRQELASYQAQDLGADFWAALDRRLLDSAERVYDNGFVSVYHRR